MGHKTKKEVTKEAPDVLEKQGEEQKLSGDEDIMLKLQEKEKEAADNYDKYVRAEIGRASCRERV
jgi:hypothetical protein